MNDPYLHINKSYNRLLKDYKAHGSLVVAYDFDNTVFDYHEAGCTYELVIRLLRRCANAGFYLICFTANEDYEFVSINLNNWNIPFDSINENPPFFKSDSKKIYYNTLLDDRAGLIQTYTELDLLLTSIGF